MKIACCQFAPINGNIVRNFESVRTLVHAAEADICVFPELALTGYFFKTISELSPVAQRLDGELCHAIAAVAKAESKAIIIGFLERSGDLYYNSAIAFDSGGKLVGHYRKVHRFYFETCVFESGDLGFPVFELLTRSGEVMTGMLICYDWRFPEAARSLALQGAELIAIPSNIVTTTGMLHATLQTRAFENKVVVAFCDRTGSEVNGGEALTFRGESALISYSGEILRKASAEETETIIADFDLAKTRDKRINQFNDVFSDRRPECYSSAGEDGLRSLVH